MIGQVLFTGATGFLGTQIIRRLIKKDCNILVLVRGKDYESALNHLKRSWREWPNLIASIDKNVQIINGDLSEYNLGLDEKEYDQLTDKINYIIHCAADLRLDASLEELRVINVQGTANIIKLGEKAHHKHGLKRLIHISTAYVAGKREGSISEESLSAQYGFSSNYERSKYESEILVKNSKLPNSIIRPGMIIGDSNNGYIQTFNTVYVFMRLYLNQQLKIVPVNFSLKLNIIPVDYVAEAVITILFKKDAQGKTFHLTAPNESLPTIKEMVEFINNWAFEELDLKISKPLFIPLAPLIINGLERIKKHFNPKNRKLIENLVTLAPYFNEKRKFLRKNTEKIMGAYHLDWREYLPNILEFAVYYGFFHRSTRTVHEQVMFRLKSNSKPVQYFDIVNKKSIQVSAEDIHKKMVKAIKSLHHLGIKEGDRVAIVGYNSSRYLILDVAIGICGAVSVPLYYTSPLSEIKEIIEDSGSKILFVGTPEILEKLNNNDFSMPVVSFSESDNNLNDSVISWNEFLKLGIDIECDLTAPVNFSDTATIRYTSGTTGKPRGVMFTHHNIRWMAETMASLPTWKERNRQVNYLSFLPMNHVVEGILGTYSPYYAPAPLKLYFLEIFHELKDALTLVRPTIFFSVPRFYEKVWSEISSNYMGQLYLKSNSPILKSLLAKLLKIIILRKTGLNRCSQLIVGSAAVSQELLLKYHELGIEVHNAYGLTEAPLVTINRKKHNKIGTVGKPLPETVVKTLEDDEILVKGPQVTAGYFRINSKDLFQEGWLKTGDYGKIDDGGNLIITGRKKEVIINSYGKTINPLKIEALLRDIPEVAEAMVVGDGKPYCSALIWIEAKVEIDYKKIEYSIIDLNKNLSNPEQIKKWAVMVNDLSVESGDLTANMKLKRDKIAKRYLDEIYYLYGQKDKPSNILHSGKLSD
ncbi:MAG: SDR family oxidoreductase [Methanomicrobiales archaeon]